MQEKVEFINACPWCTKFEVFVEDYARKKGIIAKIYKAGKDFDYLKKYGAVMKSILIINESKKYQTLSEEIIKKAIDEAV